MEVFVDVDPDTKYKPMAPAKVPFSFSQAPVSPHREMAYRTCSIALFINLFSCSYLILLKYLMNFILINASRSLFV